MAMLRVMSRMTFSAFFSVNLISSRSPSTFSIWCVCPSSVSATLVPTLHAQPALLS